MKYTKKVPYLKEGDKFDKAFRKLPKEQKEAILKISSAQAEQEIKDKLSSVGAGFRIPSAAVAAPVYTRSGQIENTVGKKAARTRGEAFQQARERGDKEFPWKGKRYHTRTAEEEAKAAGEAAAKERTVTPGAPVTTAVTEAPVESNELSDEELQAALVNSGTDWLNVDPLSPDEVASKALIDAQQYLAKNPQQRRDDYKLPPTPITAGDMSWFMKAQSNNIPRYGISQRPNNLSTPIDPIIDAEGNPVAVEQSPLSFQDPEYIKQRLSMYVKEVGLQPFADPSYDEPMYIDFKGNIFGMEEVLEGFQIWENNRRMPSTQEIYDQEVRYKPTAMDTPRRALGGKINNLRKLITGGPIKEDLPRAKWYQHSPSYSLPTGRRYENYKGEMEDETGKRYRDRLGRDVTIISQPRSAGGYLNSSRFINKRDTTYVSPNGDQVTKPEDIWRHESVHNAFDRNFRPWNEERINNDAINRLKGSAGGLGAILGKLGIGKKQQGGNIENKQEVLIADFVIRYLKGLGVPEENIISSDGSLNQEHVPAIQEVLAEIGDSAEFWSMYEQNPDEVISQYIQSKNPGAAQMARKGAKLQRLSKLRIYFRGGPTPYVSDFKRASDKKIAWSEKYGQDDLSGVERRDSQMSTPYVSDFKRASDKKIAWSEKYGQDDLSGVERRDSQMSTPMPESIRAKQELLSNSRRGLLRNTTINPKFNNPRFNFNKYLLKR